MPPRSIHPFPARMAPEIALAELGSERKNSIILDPMAGSGTVLRQACDLGHVALGFDMDPLAVLMSKVWNTPVADDDIKVIFEDVQNRIETSKLRDIYLPWIDDDEETANFIKYWFGHRQRNDLRRVAASLAAQNRRSKPSYRAATDVLRIALSRIIITKEQGASLARDTSHSRPHRVSLHSEYDVLSAFKKSIQQVRRRLSESSPSSKANVQLGDARSLSEIADGSIDTVLTSPPYLNAIDYMRGHRLSLVWLGYRLASLRDIRSRSIGVERGIELGHSDFDSILSTMGNITALSKRHQSMISRYAYDAWQLMAEVRRVLKPGGKAVLVVGNSRIRDVFISNSNCFVKVGERVGLKVTKIAERELPERSRYLPIPRESVMALGKRMRTEVILTFTKSEEIDPLPPSPALV